MRVDEHPLNGFERKRQGPTPFDRRKARGRRRALDDARPADNERKAREVLDSHLSMMEALGRAIAKRDSDTDAHNYRVAWIAARLAEGMGLAGSAMQALIAGSFLWSLVSCVLANYFLVDDGETLHQLIGYLASMLVAARIVWGLVGSRHARFAEFFPTPARMRRHLERLMSGRQEFHPGHNPVGALMMLALITLVLALGVTGFMQTLDAFWGERSGCRTYTKCWARR